MANGRSRVGVPRGPEPRGRTRWGVVAAVLALPVLLVAGLLVLTVVRVLTDDEETDGTRLKKVPCAEALAFGGAALPAGARDAECTVQSWLDTNYQAEFRMPRAGVGPWLTAAYPDAPGAGGPGTQACAHGSDHCFQLDVTGRPGTEAYYVDVTVTYENAETARVRYSAFTT
ncbi:Tfp pilus assembly protein PilX [Streptomyces sp. 3330]|uniref:hypothetical protein n=1 Tax=Streptomyces sp. 3330 TaxID=2817755 RepID=UPI00285476F9|nr:hypothetical protein [Streptomyces sp. 3330]MDR6976441.1 Tfp pilus assembly protein PilX [Streptomyces sp. 3330]